MVKSKKMSKTSIAVIVLALLLVLSLVMGITGAWFTDSKDGQSTNENPINFGTVAVTAGVGAIQYTGAESIANVVDHDTFSIGANSFANASDVDIYYAVWYKVDLCTRSGEEGNYVYTSVADATIRGYFTGLTETLNVGHLAENGEMSGQVAAGTITFDSDGDMNGEDAVNYYLVATITVNAVQAAHVAQADIDDLLGLNATEATAKASQIEAAYNAYQLTLA